ncbi:hypothetical protein FAM09_11520 [Niastella caeni]|uniref:Uncharacterized protein n=1 Tax=Niastella caeni TaxID=2569763 RepID=A0A4S8I365_9BACT|nr:hypothetical protein [Niastella caeni]THU40482.1 hypothetical protein FAM09_11520 [Niastella caeni]
MSTTTTAATTKKHDDLEATKAIIEALEPFEAKERERIIRWACEKLGIIQQTVVQTAPQKEVIVQPAVTPGAHAIQQGQSLTKDLKTFLSEKSPKSNNQLAAAVAYYYMFEAPQNERKHFIVKEDLQNACRIAGLERLTKPEMTLFNAYNGGLLDKGAENGTYKINSVGENLVAMTMPSANGKSNSKRAATKKSSKKAGKKK